MMAAVWSWLVARASAFLALIIAAFAVLGTIYMKGRSEGKQAERQRSKKAVETVQKEMDREMQKPVSGNDTIEKLERGRF